MQQNKSPGVTREQRISDEGLVRLEKQLVSGTRMSSMVLAQWVKRYGDSARALIRQYNRSYPDMDSAD